MDEGFGDKTGPEELPAAASAATSAPTGGAGRYN